MASRRRKRHETVATLGGAALLLWLLLRGEGAGRGRKPRRDEAASRVRIRISDAGITVDGEPATFDEAVARATAAGAAEVLATGAARYGTVEALTGALRAAGVTVW